MGEVSVAALHLRAFSLLLGGPACHVQRDGISDFGEYRCIGGAPSCLPRPPAWVSTKVISFLSPRLTVVAEQGEGKPSTKEAIYSFSRHTYLLPGGRAVGDYRPDGHEGRVHGQVQRPQSGHRQPGAGLFVVVLPLLLLLLMAVRRCVQ